MIALVLAAAIGTQPPRLNDPVYAAGAGATESCAAWLATPGKKAEGFAWILGFWSGLNATSAVDGKKVTTGHTTDGWGIVGEVQKRCEAKPSSKPMLETMAVFSTFYGADR